MDENYFGSISDERKAYWFGFICADGCVSKDGKYLVLELSSQDIDHINKFKYDINSHHRVRVFFRNGHEYARINIGCTRLNFDLQKNGCVPNKSLRICFPHSVVPKRLIKHFIRGYYDGDGCLSCTKRLTGKKAGYAVNTLSFVGTYEMLSKIRDYLPAQMTIRKEGNVYRMKTQSVKNIYRNLEFLYNEANIFLDRKYSKYIEHIKCKQKRYAKIP